MKRINEYPENDTLLLLAPLTLSKSLKLIRYGVVVSVTLLCLVWGPVAKGADYSAFCGLRDREGLSIIPDANLTLFPQQWWEPVFRYGIPCEDSISCAGATFTTTHNSNKFLGPAGVFDQFYVASGIQRSFTLLSPGPFGSDVIVFEVRSSQTGDNVLATCSVDLTVLPELTSSTHAKGQSSCEQVMTVEWQPALTNDGLGGYSYTLVSQDAPDYVETRSPDDVIELDPAVNSFTTPPLELGHTWEFNLRTVDTQGVGADFAATFWASIETCSVNLFNPREGDTFEVLELVNVFWDPIIFEGNDVTGGYNVDSIDLLKGPNFISNLLSNGPNILSLPVFIPLVQPDPDYRLRITLGRNAAGDMFPELPESLVGFSGQFTIQGSADDTDVDGLSNSFEDSFNGAGITVTNPDASPPNSASATGDAATGSTITSGALTITFPPGAMAADSNTTIQIVYDTTTGQPSVSIAGLVLQSGTTKSVEMPVGNEQAVCIDDNPNASINSVRVGNCSSPKVEVPIPTNGEAPIVVSNYTVARLNEDHIQVNGLMYTALALIIDSDLDTVQDLNDFCPLNAGSLENNGCPSPSVDINPGSDPNSINCNNEKGIIAVAILTTDDFDATTVDHTTVTFEGASEAHVNKKTGEPRRHEEDVDDDGDIDLVFHFTKGDTNLTCDSTEGTIIGELFDGLPIEGTDTVRMIE